jgi:hypothetical protein
MKKIQSLLLSLAMLVSVLPLYGFRTAEVAAPAQSKPVVADLVVSAANIKLASGVLKEEENNPNENPDEVPHGNLNENLDEVPDGNPEENQIDYPEINPEQTLEENFSAFQEGEFTEDAEAKPAPVDPQDVIAELNEAITYEEIAANESSVTDVQVLENRAEYYENQAINHVNDAVNTKKTAEEEIAKYAENADKAMETAFNDFVDVCAQDEIILDAAAEAAKQEAAAESAKCKPVALNAAYEADKAADQAESALAQAIIDKDEALLKAAEAKENYEKAQKAYDDAKAAIEKDLADGLISAEEAVKRTALAEQEAKLVYDVVLATDAAAAKAVEEAAEQARAADAALGEAVGELNQAIQRNAEIVLKDTGIAAATGAALAVTKIVTNAAERTVKNLDGEIEDLNADIADLRQKITDAEEELRLAQEAVKQLDQDKAAAEAELIAAANALQYAKDIESVASQINGYRENAELEAANQRMEELQALVDSGEATLADERELTELVIESIGKTPEYQVLENLPAGEVTWLDDNPAANERIFALDDGETTSYYMMTRNEVEDEETGETHAYLQYSKVEYTSLDSINKQQFFENAQASGWDIIASSVPTGLTATDGTNTYDVSIERYLTIIYRYVVTIDGKNYPIDGDSVNGYRYDTGNFIRHNYHPIEVDEKLEPTDEKLINDSNTISKLWDDAKNIDTLLSESEAREQAATAEMQKDYIVNYESIREGLAETQTLKEQLLEEVRNSVNPQIQETEEKIDAIIAERDGNLGDRLMVAIMNNVQNGEDSLTIDKGIKIFETVANISNGNLEWSDIWSLISDPAVPGVVGDVLREMFSGIGSSDNTDWSGIGEDLATAMDIYNKIQNNEVDLETITDALGLISNLKAAPQTKYAAASMIERIVEELHRNAVDDLKKAVDTGLQEVEAATIKVGEATLNSAEKHLVLTTAEAAKTLADALLEEADTEYKAAKKANEEAKEARDKVQALIDSGYTVNDAEVKRAKLDYAVAQASADAAEIVYQEANEAAQAARISANNARKAANKLRDPYVPCFMPAVHRPYYYPTAPSCTPVTPYHSVPSYTPVTPVNYPSAPAAPAVPAFRPVINPYSYSYLPSYMPIVYPAALRGNTNQTWRRTFFSF